MNWNYIAGFFDGEGNISIKHRKGRKPQVIINFKQKNPLPLNVINFFLNKKSIASRVYPTNNNLYYIQIARTESVYKFLFSIQNKLILKKEQANQAISVIKTQDKKRCRYSKEEILTIKKLHKSGKSFSEISNTLGRDRSRIFQIVKRDSS